MLATIDAPARRAAEAANRALAGELSNAELVASIESPWGAWWVILVLAAVNVVLAIWKPRFRSRN